MNTLLSRFGPTLGLLYGATYWGIVWYPTRWLESLGMQGAWLTLVAYTAAARRKGARICTFTEVIGIETDGNRILSVLTNQGKVHTDTVPIAATLRELLDIETEAKVGHTGSDS